MAIKVFISGLREAIGQGFAVITRQFHWAFMIPQNWRMRHIRQQQLNITANLLKHNHYNRIERDMKIEIPEDYVITIDDKDYSLIAGRTLTLLWSIRDGKKYKIKAISEKLNSEGL